MKKKILFYYLISLNVYLLSEIEKKNELTGVLTLFVNEASQKSITLQSTDVGNFGDRNPIVQFNELDPKITIKIDIFRFFST